MQSESLEFVAAEVTRPVGQCHRKFRLLTSAATFSCLVAVAIGLLLLGESRGAEGTKQADLDSNTPLHRAALLNDPDTVEELLASGAEANATNRAGATPLHYGTGSDRIVRALLKAGAKVGATSNAGLTPLLTAVMRDRSADVVLQLLRAGANANDRVMRADGSYSALTLAILGGDLNTVELLMQFGAKVNVTDGRSPLSAAAFVGDASMAQLLLNYYAHINYDSGFAGPALNFAFYAGHPQVASLLIDFGADLNAPSPIGYGTPPLVWSAYNENGDDTFAKLLVRRHRVDVNSINEAGDSALSWALKRGTDTPLVRFLREAGAREPIALERAKVPPQRDLPSDEPARRLMIRSSAQKGLALLQRSSNAFLDHGFVRDQAKCISCHQQTLPAVALAFGRERGLVIDESSLARQLVAQSAMLAPRVEPARQMDEPMRDPFVTLGYVADALAAWNYPEDAMTAAIGGYLLGVQRASGFWPAFDRRPPMEDGPIVGTTWSVRALQLYPPPNRERDVRDAMQRARSWLEHQTPRTQNERTFQLLGLVWSGQPRPALKPFIDVVLAGQGADGGWSQLPGLSPDAWATGTALVALEKANYGTWEKPYQRGVDFLLRTQYDDGSWWVRSRSWPFQVHFDSQFPHGRDQWISAAATAWATSAILLSLPVGRAGGPQPNAKELMTRFSVPAAPSAPVGAAAPAKSTTVDYTRQIQPLFERSCLGCHGAERPRGNFSLTSLDQMLRGGHSGAPAVIPGNSAASPLVRHITGEIEDLEMPPLRRRDKYPPLSADEIKLVREWIDGGAGWK